MHFPSAVSVTNKQIDNWLESDDRFRLAELMLIAKLIWTKPISDTYRNAFR